MSSMVIKIREFLRGLIFKILASIHSNYSVGGKKVRIGYGCRIELDSKSNCHFAGDFNITSNCQIKVRSKASLTIGNDFFMNNGCIIVVKDTINIGDNVQLGPYVQFYDHDHDFRVEGGLKSGQFKTAPIIVGNNVWIGAGSIILRGTVIGDNCVIGAGSLVKEIIPANTIFVQKRDNQLKEYVYNE